MRINLTMPNFYRNLQTLINAEQQGHPFYKITVQHTFSNGETKTDKTTALHVLFMFLNRMDRDYEPAGYRSEYKTTMIDGNEQLKSITNYSERWDHVITKTITTINYTKI